MKVNHRSALIDNREVQYTHIANESTVVCFTLSGSGYTYDKPLLYYSTMLLIQNQYDVVHVHYSFEKDILKMPLEDASKLISKDVTTVINEVLQNKHYKEIVFLGKSLGTVPIINDIMKNGRYKDSKLLLLTPLLKFDSIFETLLSSNHSALIVIGEKDLHYIPSRIKELQEKPNIKFEIITNANHSLDVEPVNTESSITIVNNVVKRLEQFLTDEE